MVRWKSSSKNNLGLLEQCPFLLGEILLSVLELHEDEHENLKKKKKIYDSVGT